LRPAGAVATGGQASTHRELIFKLALQHRLPAVYPYRYYVMDGGLISYGPRPARPVPADGGLRRSRSQRRKAGRPAGAGAGEVRAVINLKTAKAIGLDVPATALVRAGEVIE
jgi:putative tryptophan/tyrosine transport system substrate-binding protein